MSNNRSGIAASDETTLSTYIVSFNCARQLIDVDFFAAHFLDALSAAQSRPDIVALSLQEVAPLAYSFLSASSISRYIHRFEIAVKQAFEDVYGAEAADAIQLLATDNVGLTSVMVFAQQEVVDRVRSIEKGGTGVGLWEMGNKGAVGVRLWLEQVQDGEQTDSLTFVAAHLAPMESAWKRRNEDWKSVCQRLVFQQGEGRSTQGRASLDSTGEPLLAKEQASSDPQMLVAGANLFFAGDLNYRTSDIKPHPNDHTAWPSSLHHSSSVEAFTTLFKQDQLNRERKAGNTLHLMDEAPIDFPPTYKYADTAQETALSRIDAHSSQEREQQQLWASHRIPSWCDRILYQAGSNIKVLAYSALPIQPTSDHRPVALSANISLRSDQVDTPVKSPFRIDPEWKSKRAQARRLELLVGFATYLTLTYEGNAILAGTFIGILGSVVAFRSLLLA